MFLVVRGDLKKGGGTAGNPYLVSMFKTRDIAESVAREWASSGSPGTYSVYDLSTAKRVVGFKSTVTVVK